MEADTIYDAWRVVNGILAVSGGALTTAKAVHNWPLLDVQAKFLYLGAISFCAWMVWGNIEVLYGDVPGGPRTVLGTIPLTWLVISGLTPASPSRLAALRRMREGLDRASDGRRRGD